MRTRFIVAALAPILLALAVGVGGTQAQGSVVAATPIDGCTTLSTAGAYTLTQDAQGTAIGCIAIAAPNVSLDLGGHTLTGDAQGASVGIRVFPGAVNASISHGTVSHFDYGIAASAPYATIAGVTLTDNSTGGVLLSDAANSLITAGYVADNGAYGISLARSDGSSVTNTRTRDNGVYGIWLNDVSYSYLAHNQVGPGSIAGIYLGCSPDGAFVVSGCAANTHNIIDANSIDAGQGTGIALGAQAGDNVITNNTVANGVYGAFDADGSCGSNSWHNNLFGVTNASCIA